MTGRQAPTIALAGDTLSVHFDRFDIPAYELFLRVKGLPEYTLEYHNESETYTVSAPSRFAAMLGVQAGGKTRAWLPFPEFLFDDQVAIVRMALAAKRFACWSDCGLGKTLIQLEFARQVMHRTSGRVLLFTLNEIVNQTIEEAARFYGEALPIHRIRSREEMRHWCQHGPGRLAITNYEKMNHGPEDQVVNELRYLAGVILDESSRLKAGGGKQKWALIKSCRGIEYKLSCTATPAPNDTIEFASQASFLEKMRSDGEIIWTYFHRDPRTKEWTVKRHAREAFFQFMAGWSIYVRDPRKYGWRMNHPDVPAPIVLKHEIAPTEEQVAEMRIVCTAGGQIMLMDTHAVNAIQRLKLSQVAKGFRYLKGEQHGKWRAISSYKPPAVARLIESESRQLGLQVLVWTVFDAESTILAGCLRDLGIEHDLLTGKTAEADRLAILDRFRHGDSRVLVSRAAMLGYGQNFQQCGSMIFSGWNDSYESYYQAVRRAYRYGQTRALRVHIPVISVLEGDMLENLLHKQEKHEAAIAVMERNYIEATRKLRVAE